MIDVDSRKRYVWNDDNLPIRPENMIPKHGHLSVVTLGEPVMDVMALHIKNSDAKY